jgi:putative transcriptional regulator
VRALPLHPQETTDLTGSLLVAVPSLLDPNFRRAIIFLTRHEESEGALGVILNRPCGTTLGELTYAPEALYEVPVFEGGPVGQQQILLARIELLENGARFESLTEEDTEPPGKTLIDAHNYRAFSGYAGWSAGQLESEIKGKSWLILPPSSTLLKPIETQEEGTLCWRNIMRELGPMYRLLAEAPDDLSLN